MIYNLLPMVNYPYLIIAHRYVTIKDTDINHGVKDTKLKLIRIEETNNLC